MAGTVSGTVAAPDGALVPGTSPYQFDLPACDEMPPEKIMRMLGFEKTSDGKIIIHKKPNGYRDSSISLFDGPVRGHKIEIKFADFANEGSQWKIVLTSKTAACLRAIQDAWFNFYLENAKGLCRGRRHPRGSVRVVRRRSLGWDKHHAGEPLPTDWRQIHGDSSSLKKKSGSNGAYMVNTFCADKFKDYDSTTTLKTNYDKGNKNCGPTIRRIVNGNS